MRNSNKINLKAFNHKRDLIKKNEKLQMGIKELLAQPPLYDFVKCKVDNNELFEMFLGGNDDGVALRFYWNDSYEEYSLSLWTKISRFLEKKRHHLRYRCSYGRICLGKYVGFTG